MSVKCKIFFLLILFFQKGYAQLNSALKTNSIALFEKERARTFHHQNKINAYNGNFDISYYRCEWQVDPSVQYINGKVTIYFKLTENSSSIAFDLKNNLIVDSILHQSDLLSYQHSNDVLTVSLNNPINIGTLDSISIFYQGIPDSGGLGSFKISTHEGTPVLWTLSEPYGSRDWWPCKNGLNDKADSIDIFITHPSSYKAVSNGMLQSETQIEGGARTITHWKHLYPLASYLVCMAVTNYSVLNNSIDLNGINLPMISYCYPESQAAFEDGLQNTSDAMLLYHQSFGSYPFIKEKYGHVQFGWSGGMEHQTSTFLVNTDEQLVAHELAHQWFGNKITCASWRDIWLNEGFATFLTRFYMERKYPESALAMRQLVVDDITSEKNGSVWVNDTVSVSRIFDARLSYNKGSFVLEMLRLKLGDSLFFRGLRRYQNDSLLQYMYSTTSDLKRNLELESGMSLDKFFDQWYRGQGYPSYDIQWYMNSNDQVKIKINQQTSDPSVGFFEMPVPVTFKNAFQEKTILLYNTYNHQIFLEELDFIPDTLIIDRDCHLISRNNQSRNIFFLSENQPIVDIYPNPVNNQLSLSLHEFPDHTAHLGVYNMAGQLLNEWNLDLINGSALFNCNAANWSKGQYLIVIESGKVICKRKFLKM